MSKKKRGINKILIVDLERAKDIIVKVSKNNFLKLSVLKEKPLILSHTREEYQQDVQNNILI